MGMVRAIRSLTFAALVAAGGTGAMGDVAYNNLGPGDSYSGNGYILYGPEAPGGWTQGFRFVAQASGTVTRVTLPMQWLGGTDNGFAFDIYSDGAGGIVPGSSLGEIGQTMGDTSGFPPPPPQQIDAGTTSTITLTTGTAYWLVGRGIGSAQGTWHQNDQNQTGPRAYMAFGGGWTSDTQNMAAFRIEVQPAGGECPADYDGNESVEPADIAAFVNTWFQSIATGGTAGDWDHNGAVEPADIAAFVNVWFGALTNGC